MLQKYHPSSLFLQAEQFYNACTETAILQFLCLLGTVLLHNSWILGIFFALHFSRAPLPSIKPLCATMQRLITLPINTSLPAPGSWGSGRNSRCLLLLLTSASTAVNLDHYDASLRRCSRPGEEPGNVRRREWKEKTMSVCARTAGRERRRREIPVCLWLCVAVSEVMMKQPTLPLCRLDKSPLWLRNICAEIYPLIPFFCRDFTQKLCETMAASVHSYCWALVTQEWMHENIKLSLHEQIKCSFHICPGDCQPIGCTWQNVPHKIRFLLVCVLEGFTNQIKAWTLLWALISVYLLLFSIIQSVEAIRGTSHRLSAKSTWVCRHLRQHGCAFKEVPYAVT